MPELRAVESVGAVAGKGLEGDRHFHGAELGPGRRSRSYRRGGRGRRSGSERDEAAGDRPRRRPGRARRTALSRRRGRVLRRRAVRAVRAPGVADAAGDHQGSPPSCRHQCGHRRRRRNPRGQTRSSSCSRRASVGPLLLRLERLLGDLAALDPPRAQLAARPTDRIRYGRRSQRPMFSMSVRDGRASVRGCEWKTASS